MSEMCKVIMYKCNYNVTLIRICNNENEIYMGEIRDDKIILKNGKAISFDYSSLIKINDNVYVNNVDPSLFSDLS